jgi:hypothetical protein
MCDSFSVKYTISARLIDEIAIFWREADVLSIKSLAAGEILASANKLPESSVRVGYSSNHLVFREMPEHLGTIGINFFSGWRWPILCQEPPPCLEWWA